MYGNSLCKQAGRNRFQLWSGCKLSSLLTLHTGTRCTDDDMGCMRITDTGFQQYIIGGHCKDDTGKACVVHRVVHRVHYTEFDACDYTVHATAYGAGVAVKGVEAERSGLVNMDEHGRHLGTPGAKGCGIERIKVFVHYPNENQSATVWYDTLTRIRPITIWFTDNRQLSISFKVANLYGENIEACAEARTSPRLQNSSGLCIRKHYQSCVDAVWSRSLCMDSRRSMPHRDDVCQNVSLFTP